MERAGLKRYERRHIFQIANDLIECHGFSMRLIGQLCESAGDDRSLPNEHATHRRIRQTCRQGQFTLRYGFTHECFEGLEALAHSWLAHDLQMRSITAEP